MDPKLIQHLGSDGSGGNPPDGLPAGGASSAAIVAESVFGIKGIVGMSRAVAVLDLPVIPGTLVLVTHHERDGSTGGAPFEHAGENLHLIGFAACSGIFALSRLPAVKESLDIAF